MEAPDHGGHTQHDQTPPGSGASRTDEQQPSRATAAEALTQRFHNHHHHLHKRHPNRHHQSSSSHGTAATKLETMMKKVQGEGRSGRELQGGEGGDEEVEEQLGNWFGRALFEGMPQGRVLKFLAVEVLTYMLGCFALLLVAATTAAPTGGRLHMNYHYQELAAGPGGEGWVFTSAQLVFLIVAACFVAVTMGDFYSICGSTNPLKRQLLWVIFCINVEATCTYWLMCFGTLPIYEDIGGRPLYPLRYLMWACSTAGLVYLLDEVAQEPRQWLVRLAVASDVVTIVLGFLSNCASTPTLKWALFAAGCLTFLPTVWGMYSLFRTGARKLISRESSHYHRLLGVVTIVLWSAFPCVHTLAAINAISVETEAVLFASLDIATKAAYSMCILRSNCYSIDQLEEIKRIDREEVLSRTSATTRELDLASRILMAAKSEAGSMKHVQRTFLAHMSHELRTPLNSMIGFNELLIEDNELSSSQRSYITSALNSAKGLLSMIDNILEYSRLENTIIPLHKQDFYLEDVIDDTIDGLRSKALRQGVDIVYSLSPDTIPPALIGDPYRLGQILTHLLDNAIKAYNGRHFTEDEAVITIRVLPVIVQRSNRKWRSWHAHTENATGAAARTITLDIEVEDHGRGVPESKLNKLFLPFGQVEPLEQRQGIGLGLAIVKQLAHAMDGQVGCTSIEGVGSVFSLTNLSFPVSIKSDQGYQSDSVVLDEPLSVLLVARPPTLQSLSYQIQSLRLPIEAIDASTGDLRGWYKALAKARDEQHGTHSDANLEANQGEAPDNQIRYHPRAMLSDPGARQSAFSAHHDILIIEAQFLPLQLAFEQLPFNRIIVINAPCRGTKTDCRRMEGKTIIVDELTRPITRRILSDVISSKQEASTSRDAIDDRGGKTSPRHSYPTSEDLMVLVVDDNKVNQKVVGAILRRLGVPYEIANDGVEAIERFCEKKYDVILMDLTMPRMGGIEATRIIRRMEASSSSGAQSVDVVAMTAATSAEDEEICMQAGFTLYLPKPVKFAAVKELLDKKKAEKMKQLAQKAQS